MSSEMKNTINQLTLPFEKGECNSNNSKTVDKKTTNRAKVVELNAAQFKQKKTNRHMLPNAPQLDSYLWS